MNSFTVALLDHEYTSIDIERSIIDAAGGRVVDTDRLPVGERLAAAEDADAIIVRWMNVTPEIRRVLSENPSQVYSHIPIPWCE